MYVMRVETGTAIIGFESYPLLRDVKRRADILRREGMSATWLRTKARSLHELSLDERQTLGWV